MFFLIPKVNALNVIDQFYNAGPSSTSTWLTRTNGVRTLSSNPYMLRRIRDDKYVYCIEPMVLINFHTDYRGYYNLESRFNISDAVMERIRLIAYFGYMYPGHEAPKWYGITQYLIWQELEGNSEVFFADTRHGNRIIKYEEEIKQIRNLILSYKDLLELNEQKFTFRNLDEFDDLISNNIFLRDIGFSNLQTIFIPINPIASESEIFYYNPDAQNVYLFGPLEIQNITIEMELLTQITIQKWYGSYPYYFEEEGAIFSIYKEDEFIKNVETDASGIATFYLPMGVYRIIQIRSIDGFKLLDEFELVVGFGRSDNMLELFNEPEEITVPDTNKNVSTNIWNYIIFNRNKYVEIHT